MIEPYRMARITSFLDPGGDPGGAGFQLIQAKIALGSGGLFGVGLGESLQKAFYLPEAHTDMIAAVIGEELGMVGIGALVGLYGLFGYAGLRIAQNARDRYGKLLAAGLTSLVLVQALVNLLAVFGLAPLTGVPLPFVSYGNASMLVMLAAVGLLLNISRGGSARSAPSRRAPVGDSASSSGQAQTPKSARVVIAAGGTAGHVVPALAVADALRAEGAAVSLHRRRATAPRPSSCPRRATRSTCCASAASTAATRSAPPARCAWRRAAVPAARGCCASAAPRRCSAAAATSPARPASPRSRSACRWC